MAELTNAARKLLTEGKSLAVISTLMKDGSPQATLVWIDSDGKHVIFNTDERRIKAKNLRRDPRVAVTVINPENAYDVAFIRGRVVEMTSRGADAHLDRLAKKYLNADSYPRRQPDDQRIVVKILPERVRSMG